MEAKKEEVKFELTYQNVKDCMTTFRSKVKLQQEPADFFEQAIHIFEQVLEKGAKEAFDGKDKETNYFFSDFTPGVMRTLV